MTHPRAASPPRRWSGSPRPGVAVIDTVVGSEFAWVVTANLTTPIPIGGTSCFVAIRYIQHRTYGSGFAAKGVRLFDGVVAGAPDQGVNPPGQPAAVQLVNSRFDGAPLNPVGGTTMDHGRDYDLSGVFEGDVGDQGAPHNHRTRSSVQSLVLWGDSAVDQFICCQRDFNRDGDSGTDRDIGNFFNCLGGNCCATCPPTADFNCDGDVGTDADIETFFRVLGGGVC